MKIRSYKLCMYNNSNKKPSSNFIIKEEKVDIVLKICYTSTVSEYNFALNFFDEPIIYF
jgi:hypothetical protein